MTLNNILLGFLPVLCSLFLENLDLPQEQKTIQINQRNFTFREDILPLLKSNCNPCHFPGGKVHDVYPFDSYETVATLGLKLNTRLKNNEKDVVSEWVQSGKVESLSAPK